MTADLTALHREAFGLMVDALDLPTPAFSEDDTRQYDALTRRHTDAVIGLAISLRHRTNPDAVREAVERFRVRVGQLPVLYRRYIGKAPDHPDDVEICGPGCCADVLGVHFECPGPRAGAEVVAVR